MTATATPPPRPASPRARVASYVAAGVLGVASLSALAIGGAALYGESHKDGAGYLATDFHRFETDRSAIATDDLDVDAGGAGWIVDTDSYGKVRVQADSRTGKPLFVGIARADRVDDYLAGADHARLSEVDFLPFDADYDEHPASRAPADPVGQPFWAASTHGSGRQTLTWDVEDGDWSIVVMNADGSPRVDAGVSVGADVPVLDDVAWTSLGLGFVLALTTGGVLLVGARREREAQS